MSPEGGLQHTPMIILRSVLVKFLFIFTKSVSMSAVDFVNFFSGKKGISYFQNPRN